MKSVSGARTWMDAGAKNQDLLYVTNVNGLVNVYRYKQHTLAGVLGNFQQPMGECADRSGDVYIADYKALKIYEYAHGGRRPLYTIADTYGPWACAIDPKTGNLAVANFGPDYKEGNLEIYRHARGKPTIYSPSCFAGNFMAVGYDKYGDLLAEASYQYSSQYAGDFYYLQPRSQTLACLNMPGPTSSWRWYQVFAILWDGKYWVIDIFDLYRYSINIKAEYIDKIALSNDGYLGPVAIYRSTPNGYGTQLVGTSGYQYTSGKQYVSYWNYPAGGDPIFQISSKDLDRPYGVAISLKR